MAKSAVESETLVRNCPGCDYLVPDSWTDCRRCGARLHGPAGPPQVVVSPPRRRIPMPVIVIVVVIALCAGGAGVFVFTRGNDYPSQWDARVKPIALDVEGRRGLNFKHAVPVRFLTDSDFEKRVSVDDKQVAKHRTELLRVSAVFRAAGLIGGDVDLAQAINTTQQSNVVAFYDPDHKEVVVRGTGVLDAYTRVTLAHELTHVLQDQHFDLAKLRKRAADSKSGSSEALTALIEGDALRVEHAYLGDLSAADMSAYGRIEAGFGERANARTKNVPAVIEASFGAPYAFGGSVVRELYTEGGNNGVNAALTGPAPSTRIYFDPTAVGVQASTLPPPRLGRGESEIRLGVGNDSSIDPISLYLMLAGRLDPITALRAVDALDAVGGVAYEAGGTTCTRQTVAGRDARGTDVLRAIIEQWTATVPAAAVEQSDGRSVTFRTCDPGRAAVGPDKARISDAMTVAATRDDLMVEISASGQPPKFAVCAARVWIQQPATLDHILHDANPDDPSVRSDLDRDARAAALACTRDRSAGLA